jgi:hypothetical protein
MVSLRDGLGLQSSNVAARDVFPEPSTSAATGTWKREDVIALLNRRQGQKKKPHRGRDEDQRRHGEALHPGHRA